MPGQQIPRFQLRTTGGQVVGSNQFAGHRVILAFLGAPSDRSGQHLLRLLQASSSVLHLWGGSVVLVAPLTVDLNQLPTFPPHLALPVLVDPNGGLHQEFGAVDWTGEPAAGLFLSDPSGTVIYRALAGLGESLPSTATLIALLQFDQLAPRSLSLPHRHPDAGEKTLQAPAPARRRWAGPTAARARRPGGSPRR